MNQKNEHAVALGKMAKGKRKTLTDAERLRRTAQLKRVHVWRWKKKPKCEKSSELKKKGRQNGNSKRIHGRHACIR